jgi:hypothetical protein
MREQIHNPLTIFDIGLFPWHRLDIAGFDQQDFEASFQKIKDWFPVDPGTLHGDARHPMGQQPTVKHQKVRGHFLEGPNLLLALLSLADDNTSRHRLFVNIQTTTSFVNDFHQRLLSQLHPEDALSFKTSLGVLSNQSKTTVWGALERPGQISSKLPGTKRKPTFCHGDNLRKYTIDQFSSF